MWEQEKEKINNFSEIKSKLEQLKQNSEIENRNGNFEISAKLKYQEIPKLKIKLEQCRQELKNNSYLRLEVTSEDIAGIVSQWTGIPLQKMMESDKEKLLKIESNLEKRVIGQKSALQKTANVIRISKLGINDENRPIGSLLFLGNSGVGKTELAKSLAEQLFQNEKAIIRIDMSELMESHSVSKLIGSPPGYIGFDEGGNLTEQVRRKPYSIILFDEIEKAHPNVLNILLQLLDEGNLTDSKGRCINFKNTIIIMTSNERESQLPTFLRPELINRIDEIITFDDLSEDVITKIVGLKLKQLCDKLFIKGINCKIDSSVNDYLIKNGYIPEYGARPINRIIKNEILASISNFLLKNSECNSIKIKFDDSIIVDDSCPLKNVA